MILTSLGIFAPQPDGSALAVLKDSIACPVCKRVCYFVVMTREATVCIHCAPEPESTE